MEKVFIWLLYLVKLEKDVLYLFPMVPRPGIGPGS